MSYDFRTSLQPSDIGLILSYRCQANCAHCIYNCGKGYRDWMSLDAVEIALINARDTWGSNFQMHMSGGEPFLNFPLLLQSVRIAVDLGIPVYVETNVGWCRDLEKAEDRFRQLKEAGLGMVLVSVSPFHHESIPLQQTLDGISDARNVFGRSGTFVYQSEWLSEMSRWGLKDPVPLDHYTEVYGRREAGLRLWRRFGVISGGRAGYRLGDLIEKRPPEDFRPENCRDEILFAQHPHLDLYGNFIPSGCGGIRLGDWHSLTAVVKDYRQERYPSLLALLIEHGPFGLYQHAANKYGYEPLLEGYAGKCHLCVDVRRHLVKQDDCAVSFAPQQFYDNF